MDQFDRVRSIVAELRAFAILVRAAGTPRGGTIEMPSDAAARKFASACVLAHDCLKLGGIVDDETLNDRPDYCFPTMWRDSLIVLLSSWTWKGEAIPTRIPTGMPAKALAIADALSSFTMSLPDGSVLHSEGKGMSLDDSVGSDGAKSPALPAGAKAIDEHDAALLAFLNRSPSLRRKVADVLPVKGPQDRKAVAKRLRKLADRTPPLVDYPKGGRSGVVILPAGVEALTRATAPTPR